EQIADCTVDFDAREAGIDSPARAESKLLDDLSDLLRGQRLRNHAFGLSAKATNFPTGSKCTRCFYRCIAQKVRVRGTATVHYLGKDDAIARMHSLSYRLPGFRVLIGSKTCLAGEGTAAIRGEYSHSHDKASGRPLGIVFLVQFGRGAAFASTLAGQRRHGYAVVEGVSADLYRIKKLCHCLPF